jgi:hypothetical protein
MTQFKKNDALVELGFKKKPLRVYTTADFPLVHKKLAQFWEGDRFNSEKFLFECGAVNEKGAVIVKNLRTEKCKNGDSYWTCDRTRYDEAQNLISWYLNEFGYQKVNLSRITDKLAEQKHFDVRSLTDEETDIKNRVNYYDEPF